VFGNIPDRSFTFYVGLSAFLWLTFHLFARRAASWRQGGSDDRTGSWGERLSRLLEGLTMKTLMRDPRAGMMHAMVYYGFIVLFLGTVTLEIDHLLPADFKFSGASIRLLAVSTLPPLSISAVWVSRCWAAM
jgi:hypothetical protein